MHEMGVTRDIVETVIDHAESVGATRVRTVHLVIGFARDIVDELLEGAFKYMTRGTVAEGADLLIERIPFTVRCNQCGFVFHLDVHDEATWACPACDAERDYVLNSGMEFRIENIEIEGPAEAAKCA